MYSYTKSINQSVAFAVDLNKSENTALISAATLKHQQCFMNKVICRVYD